MIRSTLYLLDTNTVSYILNGKSHAARQSYDCCRTAARLAISAITQAELVYGFRKQPLATRLRAATEAFLTTLPVLAWDEFAGSSYGFLRAQMRIEGKSLAVMDLLIASRAMALNAVLVTSDNAFRHVAPLLTTENWATDL